MASGTIVGGNRGDEGSAEKQRWTESKVYSRKSVKGVKSNKNNNVAHPQSRTLPSKDANSSQQQFLTRFEAESDDSSRSKEGFLMQENQVTINLASRSKKAIRELRKKLESELSLVRNWMKKIEQSISVLENSHSQGVIDNVEKESNKKLNQKGKKQGGGELGHGFELGKFSNQVLKSCSSLLDKLMKHKHGWVFNKPVDPEALGLHDYFDIIKNPMDLGTVKSRLDKNWYKSPREFAEDVRLTFSNAMTYNLKGQDVYVMAEQLSKIFEDKWAIIEADYMRELRVAVDYEARLPTPASRKGPSHLPRPAEMRRILDRSESMTNPVDPKPKPMNFAHAGRMPAPKKPKVKDPHKRDMTYEEKQKLSTNLQNLPSEKLDNIVQIIKKRTSSLNQNDDEIEVDIDSVDTETLWELDRFVTNYKKSLSKNKRKAELAIQARPEAELNAQVKIPPPSVAQAPKETKNDEMNISSSFPVQMEKQGDNARRSSSSSSGSGSSSDSDRESSSGNRFDAGHSSQT